MRTSLNTGRCSRRAVRNGWTRRVPQCRTLVRGPLKIEQRAIEAACRVHHPARTNMLSQLLCNAEQLVAAFQVEPMQTLIIADPRQSERDLGRTNRRVLISQQLECHHRFNDERGLVALSSRGPP